MTRKNTWDKKIKIGNKYVPKKRILRHYAKLWKNDPYFRRLVTTDGVFVRAVYNNRPVIKRRKIKIKSFEDLRELIKDHAVEFHIPQKKLKHEMAIDIDVPKRWQKNGKRIEVLNACIDHLKKEVRVKAIVKTPSGYHIHIDRIPKRKVKKLLKPVADRYAPLVTLGKEKNKRKIIIDVAEPNIAIPGSLSITGKVYKKLR